MADKSGNIIDDEINLRLKKIMEQRNIKTDIKNNVPDAEKQDFGKKLPKRTPRTYKNHPFNQIIFGAPGTGKTYSTVEYALAIIKSANVDTNKKTDEERKLVMSEYQSYVDKGQIVFTTFHQSYGYEEFIQGIRPFPIDGQVFFDVEDGIFKRIADKAIKDEKNNYVIIIDEINRGNISKVFGELITLIEDDKRWGELNQISVSLPFGDCFAVPNNLYIIGTMNSADKSISLIDVALRRRFNFIEMPPNAELIENIILRNIFVELNKFLRIELKGTDLLIGHSFFMNKSENDIVQIFNQNIIPLLYEYFFDDENKVLRALDSLSGSDYEVDKEYIGRVRIKKKG